MVFGDGALVYYVVFRFFPHIVHRTKIDARLTLIAASHLRFDDREKGES